MSNEHGTGNGSGSDDERWFEAITGRGTLDDEAQQKLAGAIREAAHDSHRRETGLKAVMDTLESEGLFDPASELPGAAPEQSDEATASVREIHPRRSSNTRRYLALAASVAVAGLLITVGYEVNQPPPWQQGQGTVRGDAIPAEIRVENPSEAAATLASSLQQLGLEPEIYKYKGRWIIDVIVIGPDAQAVGSLLQNYGAAVPADGRLLLAFAAD